MPAGLQISTVVETFRDLEVPPALPSYEDDANIQSGTFSSSESGTIPGLQRIMRSRVLRCARETRLTLAHMGKRPGERSPAAFRHPSSVLCFLSFDANHQPSSGRATAVARNSGCAVKRSNTKAAPATPTV